MYTSIIDLVGNTPLLKLPIAQNTQLYAKLEYLNPGGSVKDRTALYLIQDAEKRGLLKPGGTIVEASTGNQGIALAMIGAAKGYKVIITISQAMSTEKRTTLKALGAKVVECPSTDSLMDPLSYWNEALRIHHQTPNSFMPNQYYNVDNRLAHYYTTGPEIWQQTQGRVTHLFAAAGTGGTVSGTGKYLKEQNPKIKVIAVDATNSYRATQGKPKPNLAEGLGINVVSDVPDYAVFDDIVAVSDEHAISMLPKMAHSAGVLVGPSGGAVAWAAAQWAARMGSDDLGVLILADSGRAYLSKGFFDEVAPSTHAQQVHGPGRPQLSV